MERMAMVAWGGGMVGGLSRRSERVGFWKACWVWGGVDSLSSVLAGVGAGALAEGG